MASVRTKFAVGLFALLGMALAAAAVIWLGVTTHFQTGQTYLAYFDESVQGLDIGSPVKYRGVTIGRVEDISVAPDASLIEVTVQVETDLDLSENMVAQLKAVGITGIMYIGLDRLQEGEPERTPLLTFQPEHPVIATKPSDIKRLFSDVSDVLDQFRQLDLEGIGQRAKAAMDRINQAVDEARIDEISSVLLTMLDKIETISSDRRWQETADAVHATMQQAERAMTLVRSLVDENRKEITSAAGHLQHSMENFEALIGEPVPEATIAEIASQTRDALTSIEQLAQQSNSLVRESEASLDRLNRTLMESLQSLDRAVRNLNRSLESLSEQPSQLLFGRPPPERPEVAD